MRENLQLDIFMAAGKFGISALKPYQLLVIQRIMEQEDMQVVRNQIVILPTGTGKSLCFLVPATLCSGITVIVYPLLALMNDQISKLEKSGTDCICIRGGQTREERAALFHKLDTGTRIVITTPESLQRPQVLNNLRRRKISLLVVDEAHVIAQWGHGFRPSYLALTNAVMQLRPHQTLAFTATASEETLKKIRTCLFFSKPLVVRGDADRPNIIYMSFPSLNRMQGTIDLIRTCSRPALVFCRTRTEARDICIFVHSRIRDIPMRYYHAGLSRGEREELEKWFMQSDDGVLFATSAYGMGMDKSNIRTVIHTRLPQTAEEYLQESGRAGRDGRLSQAYVITTAADRDKDRKPYSPVLKAFTGSGCRRTMLLGMMGQELNECSGCDFCLKKSYNTTNSDYHIRTLIRNWPFRFNALSASCLLCGSRNLSAVPLSMRMNPLYGKQSLLDQKLLERTIEELERPDIDYPVLSVRFLSYGKLLYPADSRVCRMIAKVLGFIDIRLRKLQRCLRASINRFAGRKS